MKAMKNLRMNDREINHSIGKRMNRSWLAAVLSLMMNPLSRRAAALSLIICHLSFSPAGAQTVGLNTQGEDPKYVETIKGRAQKIVDGLELADAQRAENVRNIIANRYFLLNRIHGACEEAKQWTKQHASDSERQHLITDAEQKRDAELFKHHFELESALSLFLNAKQVEAVKDGMTYGRLKRDYQATLDMIPSLTDEEKLQVLIWLREAREYAMDGSDSKQKHYWFDKYRGRTNNWLSARGYDLKKEREAWQQRINAAKTAGAASPK
jgi:hypothetical protein